VETCCSSQSVQVKATAQFEAQGGTITAAAATTTCNNADK
jgi:hypothetical protein